MEKRDKIAYAALGCAIVFTVTALTCSGMLVLLRVLT